MIKFFRKIRQRLLTESKFTKYLIYAIGEIVLVVIGILIALQINNWNEEHSARNKESLLLKEMRANLSDDLSDLNFNTTHNKRRTEINLVLKNIWEQKTPYSDTLDIYFGGMFGNFQLSENTSTWENLKSIGLDLISDDKLRNDLSYLYENRYKYLENLEKNLDDRYQWDYLYPQVLKHLTIERLWESGSPRDYDQFLKDEEFYEVIKMNITFRQYMQNEYEENRDLVEDLIIQIDMHLIALGN